MHIATPLSSSHACITQLRHFTAYLLRDIVKFYENCHSLNHNRHADVGHTEYGMRTFSPFELRQVQQKFYYD